MNSLMQLILIILPAFLLGLALSSKIIPAEYLQTDSIPPDFRTHAQPKIDESSSSQTSHPFDDVSFVIHRNGEVDPCGSTTEASLFDQAIRKGSYPLLAAMDKYDFESMLTLAFGTIALASDQCPPENPPAEIQGKKRKTWGRGENYAIEGVHSSFLTFCDMGEDHTPINEDFGDLVLVTHEYEGRETLPCRFFTREGVRITSHRQLQDLAIKAKETDDEKELEHNSNKECIGDEKGNNNCQVNIHLYAVPAGRQFMFAPSYIGEIFNLSHVPTTSGNHIHLEVLSISPRVFDVHNFYDKEESASIVEKALKETSESHRIKRSSTGASGYNLNNQRTSENGFDTHGKAAQTVKKRCFTVLGLDEYHESYADGLQVLRYNKTTAYIPHMDWIDDPQKREEHNYDSSGVGTNRYATILLYMSNITDGGETVFKKAWPNDVPQSQRKTRQVSLEEVRRDGTVDLFKRGSWEESMVADCRSRLVIRPYSARAVLFYSQHPNGEEDTSSLHGGCPVLEGEKWAANLWVWNGIRGGYPGSPKNFESDEPEIHPGQLHATFVNTGNDPKFRKAKLFFQDTFWDEFGPGKRLGVNTFEGHEWNVRDGSLEGTLLKRWVIESDEKEQVHKV